METPQKGGRGRKRAAEKPLIATKSPKVSKTEKIEDTKPQVAASPVKQSVSKAKGVPKKNGKFWFKISHNFFSAFFLGTMRYYIHAGWLVGLMIS